jgi:hypothetical protein
MARCEIQPEMRPLDAPSFVACDERALVLRVACGAAGQQLPAAGE